VIGERLYVGSIHFNVTEKDLIELFTTIGPVRSAMVVYERTSNGDPGRSKGYGFVEMTTLEDAKKAIATLHGKEHFGRAIVVDTANPRGSTGGSNGGGGGGRRGGGGNGGGGGRHRYGNNSGGGYHRREQQYED